MADTIRVRILDSNGDPMRGSGLTNFLADLDAVAQILVTRMRLLMGEWFENTADGTPLFQNLLGRPVTMEGVMLILRERILSTPYVLGIQALSVTYQPDTRKFSFSATVQTQFGTAFLATT